MNKNHSSGLYGDASRGEDIHCEDDDGEDDCCDDLTIDDDDDDWWGKNAKDYYIDESVP